MALALIVLVTLSILSVATLSVHFVSAYINGGVREVTSSIGSTGSQPELQPAR